MKAEDFHLHQLVLTLRNIRLAVRLSRHGSTTAYIVAGKRVPLRTAVIDHLQ